MAKTIEQLNQELSEIETVLQHLSNMNFSCSSVQSLLRKRYNEIRYEMYDFQKAARNVRR